VYAGVLLGPVLESGMADEPKTKDPGAATVETKTTGEASSSSKDVVLIHGTTADGKGLAVLRQRDNRIEPGLVMPIEHGKPIVGEVVTLQPRQEFPLLCDVKVEYDATKKTAEPQERRLTKGPGQVATDVYRANWDRIFQSKPKGSEGLN
jgi:hypothetical protein